MVVAEVFKKEVQEWAKEIGVSPGIKKKLIYVSRFVN
jgi:hypothetical protein